VEIFISVDVETDGPIPGPNSMLSLGAAAFIEPHIKEFDRDVRKLGVTLTGSSTGKFDPIGTFTANLKTLPGAEADPETAAWWQTKPEAWAACRKNPQPPEDAMKNFVDWVMTLPCIEKKSSGAARNAVFVGYPTGFDFTYVYWYIKRFKLESPFSFSALDIKTYAMALLGSPFRETVKRNMPKEWFPKSRPHTHVALDDAIEQGIVFMRMLEARNKIFSRQGDAHVQIGDHNVQHIRKR